MGDSLNRRDWLRVLGISGVAAGLSSLRARDAGAQESGFQSSIVNSNEVQANRASPSLIDGNVVQPRRELPVLHETDVLVVGGGPAGVCAAIADLVRLIPNCFVTGHAAGVAAAVAAQDGCRPRDVEVPKVQKLLRQQEAYLG